MEIICDLWLYRIKRKVCARMEPRQVLDLKNVLSKQNSYIGGYMHFQGTAGTYAGKVAKVEVVHEGGADSVRIHMDVVHRLDRPLPENEDTPEPDTFTIELFRLDSIIIGPLGLQLFDDRGIRMIRLLTLKQLSTCLDLFLSGLEQLA